MDFDSKVHIEYWLDKSADNIYEKLFEFTDDGDWSAKRKGKNGRDCKDRPDNWVILHPTDAVRFRADYANPVYVKDASVREIGPLL